MLKYLLRTAVAVSLLVILCCGVNHFSAPREVRRTHYPTGELHTMFEVDDNGQPHGEYWEYWPNGKPKVHMDRWHGALGSHATEFDSSGDVISTYP